MSTLTLCIITKNEEKYLEQCINSVKSIADEIVVVDTGSTDRTKEIAKAFNAKIIDFKWQDSFSAAKNEAISHATKEWILVMDADEVIEGNDLEKIKGAIKEPNGNSAFSLDQRSYIKEPFIGAIKNNSDFSLAKEYPFFVSHRLVRLFRNNLGLEFRHRVHELVEDSLREKSLKFSELDAVLHHFGSLKGEDFTREKAEMYKKLIFRQLEDNPQNPRYNFQAARMFLGEGNLTSALKYFENTAKIDPNYRLVFSEMAKIFLQLKDYNKAVEHFGKSIKQKPDDISAYNNLAVAYMMMGKADDAKKLLEEQLKKHPGNNALLYNYNKLVQEANRK
ncbi:glycosyltransferase [Candidatus Woesearchaeota archaeon]|nr:glycosyltransferase [Candidatus Woesearchaeota archaeon]